MARWIPYALVALAAVAGVAIWIWMGSVSDESSAWIVHAEAPVVVGVGQTPYGYGGSEIHPANGSIEVSWTPGRGGTIDFWVEVDGHNNESLQFTQLRGSAVLDASSSVFEERVVLGGTGTGSVPLPETHALLAGAARFEVMAASGGDEAQLDSIKGWWMIADALRRSDGAIRQSGLVYSPLLREQSGFSDPTRTEATLILGDGAEPLLQVVFAEVLVVQSPSRTITDQAEAP